MPSIGPGPEEDLSAAESDSSSVICRSLLADDRDRFARRNMQSDVISRLYPRNSRP